MKLRPEQRAVLDYLQQQGTDVPTARLIDSVRHSFAAFDKAIDGLDEDLARRSPRPDSWSVQEIVDHLATTHGRGAEQLAAVFGGQPIGEAIPPSLQSSDPLAKTWTEAVTELKAIHNGIVEHLSQLPDDLSFDLKVPISLWVKAQTEAGDVETLHWIENCDWKAAVLVVAIHTDDHRNQVQRTLAALD